MANNMFITRLDSRRQAFGAAEIVTIDIYRMKDGQAVEHWDAIISVVKTTASGQTPALPVPRSANDATREKQIPFRHYFA